MDGNGRRQHLPNVEAERAMTDLDKLHAEVLDALRAYQQADAEGVMVLVSRQAVDEAITLLEGIAAMRRERDDLRNEKLARSQIDPVTRLHNLCDGLAESRRESPFDKASWDLADEQNRELQWRIASVEAERDALQRDLDAALADAEGMKNALLRYIDPSAPFWKEHDAALAGTPR